LRTTTRVVLLVLAAALLVLAATGVWLWFRYEPTAARAWKGTGSPADDEGWIRMTHRLASHVVVLLALAALVLVVVRRIRDRVRGVVAATGLLVTAAAASFTGYLLPWDQLALWAVTVGSEIGGVQAAFRSEVKYILVGSREVSPGTYRFWAITHVVLGVLVAVGALLVWLRGRDRAVSRPPSSPPPAAPPSRVEPQAVR
jgi:quinol-cytochrome oxidoreductase complex cytochrome b subunit